MKKCVESFTTNRIEKPNANLNPSFEKLKSSYNDVTIFITFLQYIKSVEFIISIALINRCTLYSVEMLV
jgi:hypothetical protein